MDTICTIGTIDTIDTIDTMDAMDTMDTMDTTDAMDATDAIDAMCTMDTMSTTDAIDTKDAMDAMGTINTIDVTDTTNTMDAIDTIDTIDTIAFNLFENSCLSSAAACRFSTIFSVLRSFVSFNFTTCFFRAAFSSVRFRFFSLASIVASTDRVALAAALSENLNTLKLFSCHVSIRQCDTSLRNNN